MRKAQRFRITLLVIRKKRFTVLPNEDQYQSAGWFAGQPKLHSAGEEREPEKQEYHWFKYMLTDMMIQPLTSLKVEMLCEAFIIFFLIVTVTNAQFLRIPKLLEKEIVRETFSKSPQHCGVPQEKYC